MRCVFQIIKIDIDIPTNRLATDFLVASPTRFQVDQSGT